MTAVLVDGDLLKFRVDYSMLNLEFAMVFPLNAFLQGPLVQRMAKSELSSRTENILSPLLIELSSLNRQLETVK
jgi:hypothetical protein